MSTVEPEIDPLFGAAVLKLSMIRKGLADSPGFRVVYAGCLRDLKVSDAAVDEYIADNMERLSAHLAGDASKE